MTHRRRYCSNPLPVYGGKLCEGDFKEDGTCNVVECPSECLSVILYTAILDMETMIPSPQFMVFGQTGRIGAPALPTVLVASTAETEHVQTRCHSMEARTVLEMKMRPLLATSMSAQVS